MPLCTQTQVEQRLQIDFASDTDPVCAELIAAAQGHIERIVGRPLEDDDYTETFDAPEGPDLWLTYTPVNSVASVVVDGVTLSTSDAYVLQGSAGRLTRTVNDMPRPWGTKKLQSIAVTYNGGYVTVPNDIQDICAWMAARAFQVGVAFAAVPSGAEGIKQVALAGSDSVTYADVAINASAAVNAVAPLPNEVEALTYYRHLFV